MSERKKVIEWADPRPGPAAMPKLTGLEYMQQMMSGALPAPPIASLMDFTLSEVSEGTVSFVCTPDESHYNPLGIVHGGLVCTLLDSALGCAVQTTLPQGSGYTSIEIKVSYLRGVTAESGELTVTGVVTKPGSRVAFAEGEVTDGSGKVVATATGTCLVFQIG